eukprot:scaffold3131_cov64-Attheya_sp.AAC.3
MVLGDQAVLVGYHRRLVAGQGIKHMMLHPHEHQVQTSSGTAGFIPLIQTLPSRPTHVAELMQRLDDYIGYCAAAGSGHEVQVGYAYSFLSIWLGNQSLDSGGVVLGLGPPCFVCRQNGGMIKWRSGRTAKRLGNA